MSNQPPTWELLLVPEGMKKVTMEMDTKIPNAATFTILKEDHTLGNILRNQLMENPKVLFAGYKVPHPLEHQFVLKVQTTLDTTPMEVLKFEINNLISSLNGMMHNFQNELTLHGIAEQDEPMAAYRNMDRDF